jgi:hypothetical protein
LLYPSRLSLSQMGQTCSGTDAAPKDVQVDPSRPEDGVHVPPARVSRGPRTAYRPPSETLKMLKSQEEKKASEQRWAATKADWEANVIAEMEKQKQLSQPEAAPGTEADRYAPDERQNALQMIKEDMEFEESQRAKDAQDPVVGDEAIEISQVETAVVSLGEEPIAPGTPQKTSQDETAELSDAREPQPSPGKWSITPQMGDPTLWTGTLESCDENTRLSDEKPDAPQPAQAAERKEILDAFLTKNGFDGVSNKRRRMLRPSVYPLHLAAEKGDAELIRLLLEAGADRLQKDSSGRTPQDVAKKKNRKGSHDETLAALAAL